MSLTSHLRDSSSPVRRFIREEFTNTRTLLADARKQVRATDIIKPIASLDWSTIGTALDYRIRYYFDITPMQDMVAYAGAAKITDLQPLPETLNLDSRWTGKEGDPLKIFDETTGRWLASYFAAEGGLVGIGQSEDIYTYAEAFSKGAISGIGNDARPLKKEYQEVFISLNELTNYCDPRGRRLTTKEEQSLNRHCVVLALLEQVYRAGLRPNSPLVTRTSNSANELLEIAESHWLDDLGELSWCFFDRFRALCDFTHT